VTHLKELGDEKVVADIPQQKIDLKRDYVFTIIDV